MTSKYRYTHPLALKSSLCTSFMLFWCSIRSKQPVNHALNKAHHVQWLKVYKISLSESLYYGDLISIGCALTMSARCCVFTDNSCFPQPSELPHWIHRQLSPMPSSKLGMETVKNVIWSNLYTVETPHPTRELARFSCSVSLMSPTTSVVPDNLGSFIDK